MADTSAQKLSADPSGKQRQHYAAAYQSTAALQPLKQVLPQEAMSLGSSHFTEPGQQPGTRVVYLERRPLPQPPLKQARSKALLHCHAHEQRRALSSGLDLLPASEHDKI